jgi:hypothetical protein
VSEVALTTLVAGAITLVSILIAIAAWRGSEAASRASDLDGTFIQQVAMRQQELQTLTGFVELDERLLPRYQAHVLAATQLQAAAGAAPAGSSMRNLLELRAQGERAVARVMRPFFTSLPSVDANGVVSYDRDFVLRTLIAGSTRLPDLRPDVTTGRAEVAHGQANAFVVVVVMLALALVLLTIAQVAHGRRRLTALAAGSSVAALGLVALVLVELVMFRVG